tara:strand:+ start:368 stop:721 length:354 start_codon:yes stop_codon:yes gene_type:complete
MKEKYYSRLGILMFLIVLSLLFSVKCYSQIVVTEFNACWNKENTTGWLDSLQDCYITKVEMDRLGKRKLQTIHNVTIVPTLIIFKDGKEVKRFLADISFSLKTTRREVQLFINELTN